MDPNSKPADATEAPDTNSAPPPEPPKEEAAASEEENPFDLELDDVLDADEDESFDTDEEEAKPEEVASEPDLEEPQDDETEEAASEEQPEGEQPAAEATETAPADGEETPAPEVPPVPSQEELQQHFDQWRTTAIEEAAERYALPPELVQELEEDGVSEALIKNLPQWQAQIYVDSLQAAMGTLVQHLPNLIETVQTRQSLQSQQEQEFFNRWPQLKNHVDAVTRVAKAYRQSNPNADIETFINEVGASTMIALKLPQDGPAVEAKPETPAPFKPAGTTPAPAPPSKKEPSNAFEALDDEFSREELDLD